MTSTSEQDTRERVKITNGTLLNIRLAISDSTAFNRYVIKEHGSISQGEDVFGKLPAADCVTNCLYDELNGWLDNPNILGLTILDISFNRNKIEELDVSAPGPVNTHNLIKFIGSVAAKKHTLEDDPDEALQQLEDFQVQARELLKGLLDASG